MTEKLFWSQYLAPERPALLNNQMMQWAELHRCRRSGNGAPQTCLPAAHGVAPLAAQYGPSSPANAQDPREGPSLPRRTTPRPPWGWPH